MRLRLRKQAVVVTHEEGFQMKLDLFQTLHRVAGGSGYTKGQQLYVRSRAAFSPNRDFVGRRSVTDWSRLNSLRTIQIQDVAVLARAAG